MTKAMIIKADETIPVEVRGIVPDLAALQHIVAPGGNIEHVTIDGDVHAYCDEEGKLRGDWLDRINVRATLLVDHFRPGFVDHDMIVGDVVVLGSTYEGDEADVPEYIVEYAGELVAWMVGA